MLAPHLIDAIVRTGTARDSSVTLFSSDLLAAAAAHDVEWTAQGKDPEEVWAVDSADAASSSLQDAPAAALKDARTAIDDTLLPFTDVAAHVETGAPTIQQDLTTFAELYTSRLEPWVTSTAPGPAGNARTGAANAKQLGVLASEHLPLVQQLRKHVDLVREIHDTLQPIQADLAELTALADQSESLGEGDVTMADQEEPGRALQPAST
ncbi:hypothetical protein AMAG_03287 [Allomyces macrogynus ATCC 38327]|uniref:Uncharacterized protein n=1 Tax=Allomyces macrogynus (strain ATCC 38327) TaxID=578462 RepID=A0A0L0S503_ALLM3|nr:hypothetical protein AMAG_03287 [Allomyces macrogynus ATCC 38327]|eukprot:KNE57597.1 hypothetical protein AMAG_03287 [Allomyces macrogynus ATCC 38327]